MQLPTTRQLQAFLAVADAASFRIAAEVCEISQPALSQLIQGLETGLGTQLFERDSKGVRLTHAGRKFQKAIAPGMVQLGNIVTTLHAEEGFLPPKIRVGIIPTIAPYLLPGFLPRLTAHFPETRVVVQEGQTGDIVARTIAGELDFVILALEGELGNLELQKFGFEPFFLLTQRGHPLSAGKTVNQGALSEEQVLLLEDGHCLSETTLALCQDIRPNELGDFRASALTTLVKLVEAGHGVTILPQMAVSSEINSHPNLIATRFENPKVGRALGVAWRRSSPFADQWKEVAAVLSQMMQGGEFV